MILQESTDLEGEIVSNGTNIQTWNAQAGDTYLKPSGPANHLFIVLFDPFKHVEAGYGDFLYVASVNITSIGVVKFDSTCILNPGDHPFIVKPSYVNYRMMESERFSVVKGRIESGEYRLHQPLSKVILEKVVSGIFKSDDTKTRFRLELKHFIDR